MSTDKLHVRVIVPVRSASVNSLRLPMHVRVGPAAEGTA